MADDNNTASTESTAAPPKRRARPRLRAPQMAAITIDDERITASIRRDSRHCMIAEAIKAAMPDLSSIIVDLQSIRVTDSARRLRFTYLTPRVCQQAIIDFDQGIKPEPFSFTLKRPAHITRGGKQKAAEREKRVPKKDRQAAYRQERAAIIEQIRAPDENGPFKPPREYVDKVIEAMDDPTADLGPVVAVQPPDDRHEHAVPILVGGLPPRHPGPNKNGNIQRKRMFGLRELVR